LNWFQKSLLNSTQKQDIAVSGNQKQIKLCNLGSLNLPMPLSLKLGDSIVDTRWFNQDTVLKWSDFSKWDTYDIKAKDSISVSVELTNAPLDIYPQNNQLNFTRKNPIIQLKPLFNFENNLSPTVFWMPIYGWNTYNKSMLGLAFYNSILPEQANEFTWSPMYSFQTNNINGYFDFKHRFYPLNPIIKNIVLGLQMKSYAHQIPDNVSNTNIQYSKFEPYIETDLKPSNARSNISQRLYAGWAILNNNFQTNELFKWNNNMLGLLHVKYNYERAVCFFPAKAQIEYQLDVNKTSIHKLGLSFEQGFEIEKGKKTIKLRLFGGLFLKTNQAPIGQNWRSEQAYFMAGGTTGLNDYLFNETLLGRAASINPSNSIYDRQIILNEAAFRANAFLGSSDKWMTAVNVTLPIPKIRLPIGLYFDMNYAPIKTTTIATNSATYTNQFSYVSGVYLALYKDLFAIYFPVEALCSNELRNYWNLNNQNAFFEKANFVLNLKELNPIKLIRNFSL
jgi:hypothetical protein